MNKIKEVGSSLLAIQPKGQEVKKRPVQKGSSGRELSGKDWFKNKPGEGMGGVASAMAKPK